MVNINIFIYQYSTFTIKPCSQGFVRYPWFHIRLVKCTWLPRHGQHPLCPGRHKMPMLRWLWWRLLRTNGILHAISRLVESRMPVSWLDRKHHDSWGQLRVLRLPRRWQRQIACQWPTQWATTQICCRLSLCILGSLILVDFLELICAVLVFWMVELGGFSS